MCGDDKTWTLPRASRARAVRRLRTLFLVHPAGIEPARPHPVEGRRLVLGRQPGEGGLRLADEHVSRRHAELIYVPERDVYRLRDRDSHNGTFLDGRPITAEYLRPGSVIGIGGTLLVYSEVIVPGGAPALAIRHGTSLARALAEGQIDRLAPSTLPVVIVGPTGAGKERLARRLHARSERRGELVAVNCATFTPDLVASELFGHVRGGFTGAASDRKGLFVQAKGGTLFLDEIAELPLEQQPKLLRALEERRVRPVGADREIPIDARVVAATHQDLEALCAEGAFRRDLLARLAGATVVLPGLADRREEILPLFRQFLGRPDLTIDGAAAEALLLHDWPDNVRGLIFAARNALLSASDDGHLERAHLPEAVLRALPDGDDQPEGAAPDEPALAELLRKHAGNVSHVAGELGRPRQTVYRWLSAFGLDPAAFRD